MHLSLRHARALRLPALFLVVTLATGCATAPATDAAAEPPPPASYDANDPLAGFNRAMFVFNENFDRYLLKPVAKGYRAVTPAFARRGLANFFGNLYEPINVVNNVLQGKFVAGVSDLGRFAVNSTLGIYGLFDVATHMGLERHDEDFGQTLAVWGVGEGPYLVLPVLGPSNFRDAVGEVPDWYLYPTQYMEEGSTADKLWVGRLVVRREQLLDASDILDQAAGEDPYVFRREAYREYRRHLIFDGNPPAPPPDPSLFEDDPPPPDSR
jgi:phospholipid-binding lipoprotein MlaA